MKYIQIKCKIHQTRTHYNTHFLRAPFFFLHAYGPLRVECIIGLFWQGHCHCKTVELTNASTEKQHTINSKSRLCLKVDAKGTLFDTGSRHLHTPNKSVPQVCMKYVKLVTTWLVFFNRRLSGMFCAVYACGEVWPIQG